MLAVVAWQVLPSRERSGPPLKLAKAEHAFEAKAPVPEPVAAPADKLDLFTKPTPEGLDTGRERQTAAAGTLKDSSDLESNRRGRATVPNRLLGDPSAGRRLAAPDTRAGEKTDGTFALSPLDESLRPEPQKAEPTVSLADRGQFDGAGAGVSVPGAAGSTAPANFLEKRAMNMPKVALARRDAPPPNLGATTVRSAMAPSAPSAPSPAPPASRLRMVAAPPVLPAPAANAPAGTMGDAQTGGAARYFFKRQSGAQNLAAKLKEKQTAPEIPLSSFEFEQSGNTVRVIDGDGSIYSGHVLSSEDEAAGERGGLEAAVRTLRSESRQNPKRSNGGTAPQSFTPAQSLRAGTPFAFRVAGIHRTSGQRITLEGTLAAAADAVVSSDRLAGGAAPSPAQRAPQPPAPTPADADAPSSQQLVGRLSIGGSNEVTIIAVPMAK